jgi:hypothetical protein
MSEHTSGQQPDPVDMDALTFLDEPVIDVPPPATADNVKVPRTYRLPVEFDQWITATAQAKGVRPSDLVRDLLELGRAAYEQVDRPVSMADVLAAIMSVRPRDAA